MHQSNRRILAQSGFFGSFDAPCSEWSWINLFCKESRISDLGIQSWIFLKKRTLRVAVNIIHDWTVWTSWVTNCSWHFSAQHPKTHCDNLFTPRNHRLRLSHFHREDPPDIVYTHTKHWKIYLNKIYSLKNQYRGGTHDCVSNNIMLNSFGYQALPVGFVEPHC